jgi:SAM-dependent methyltransferase
MGGKTNDFSYRSDMVDIFTEVYEKKMWGGANAQKFYSGSGSNDDNTFLYREYVQRFIVKHNIKSVLDIGCGDFRLGKLMDWRGLKYVGADVVSELVAHNNHLYADMNVSFLQYDITKDNLPSAELYLIRQVFQHFSNEDIHSSLEKLTKSKFVLITDGMSITPPQVMNKNKTTDRYTRVRDGSGLYLESSPFNLDAKTVLSYLSINGREMFRTLLVGE